MKTKMKTHSGAKKRLKITASGKILARGAGLRHNLSKKRRKVKRQGGKLFLSPGDAKKVKRALPYGLS